LAAVIPGVTYHPRSSWEDPNLPVYDPPTYVPPRHDLALVDTIVDHYTAADDLIDGDPGEHADDLPGYLRAIQRDYRNRHGFSIGYSWALDWLGGVWELRGWEYRPAATGGLLVGGGVNPRSFAILCLVDGNDPLTHFAVASHRRIVAEIERRCRRRMRIGPHSEFDPTGCCGDGIRAQIAAGLLRPLTQEDPMPPATPEPYDAPLPPALDALAVVMAYCASHPGGGSQGALWDVVLPHMTGVRIPVGDPRRTEFEQAARYPGGGRLAAAWAAVVG
jgi:hypothetical protein